MKLFVFRIWDNNDNLNFCISVHSSFIHANFMRLLVLLITRIGKRFSDCGKQEARDPGAVFPHLGFPSLHLNFVRRKSGHVDQGTFRLCPHNRYVQVQQAGSKTYCRLEPVLLCAGTSRCFMCWHSALSGICTEMRIQALLPKHRDGHTAWKAQWPWGHGSMPRVICDTRCYFGPDISENRWACVVAISIQCYV